MDVMREALRIDGILMFGAKQKDGALFGSRLILDVFYETKAFEICLAISKATF